MLPFKTVHKQFASDFVAIGQFLTSLSGLLSNHVKLIRHSLKTKIFKLLWRFLHEGDNKKIENKFEANELNGLYLLNRSNKIIIFFCIWFIL